MKKCLFMYFVLSCSFLIVGCSPSTNEVESLFIQNFDSLDNDSGDVVDIKSVRAEKTDHEGIWVVQYDTAIPSGRNVGGYEGYRKPSMYVSVYKNKNGDWSIRRVSAFCR